MNLKRLKRIVLGAVSFACAAAITATCFPPISAFAAATATTTDYLNLREGAGADKKVILTLSKGVSVTILDNSNAQWAKVQTASGKQGYCSKQYLSAANPSSSGTANPGTSTSGTAATTTSALNLRSGAGTTYSIVVTIAKGASVKVIDNSNSTWAKVQTSDGKQGYCSKQYLKFSGATSSNTTNPTNQTTPSNPTGSSGSAKGTASTTDYLNLRQGAGTNYKVVVTLGKGVTVTVLDSSNAQWTKVQTSDGKQGYCSKQYLKFASSGSTTPPASSTPPATGTTGTLTGKTTSSLNVRSGAGTNYGIVATLAKGTNVTVMDNSNSQWAKVKTADGKEGYCSKEFLTITQTGTNTNPGNTNSGGTGDTGSGGTNPGNSGGTNTNSGDTDSGDTNTNPGDTGSTGSHTITGASVTADVLRLRDQPNTTGNVVANLPNGTNLTVLDASDSTWIKVQTAGGQTGYVSAEFIKIHYSDEDTGASALSLSTSSQSIPVGKTLYIQASISPSGTYINWTSSNPAVATVSNGYVYAVANGTAVITASSGSYQATCSVTVTDAEPVKTAFASPNIASTGATVTLTAVTDFTRDGVRFVINMPNGGTTTVDASTYTMETKLDTTVKKWVATTTFDTPGTYSFTTYSSLDGVLSTAGYTTNAYVSAQQDFVTTTSEERRASDQMITLIANWEGYRATVYADQLTSNQVPTIGYGCTLGANAVFYNNMTETEAWSMLLNKINNSSYTTELNKMIQNNHFLMSQNQADCLISFAYNVGAGYFNSSSEMDFRRIMKNAVVPPDFSTGLTMAATVTKDTVLRGDASVSSSEVCSVNNGTVVTVIGSNFGDTRNGWYNVMLTDGRTGWINSGYVNLSNSDSLVHDLNYTNSYAFGTDLIRWNQAGGKFYAGLFYRRLGEANVYNYGDYSAARSNLYGYTYPSAAAGLS